MKNPIVQEVRAAREGLAAKFDFDLHRICEDAMKRQEGGKTVSRATGTKRATKPDSKGTSRAKRKTADH